MADGIIGGLAEGLMLSFQMNREDALRKDAQRREDMLLKQQQDNFLMQLDFQKQQAEKVDALNQEKLLLDQQTLDIQKQNALLQQDLNEINTLRSLRQDKRNEKAFELQEKEIKANIKVKEAELLELQKASDLVDKYIGSTLQAGGLLPLPSPITTDPMPQIFVPGEESQTLPQSPVSRTSVEDIGIFQDVPLTQQFGVSPTTQPQTQEVAGITVPDIQLQAPVQPQADVSVNIGGVTVRQPQSAIAEQQNVQIAQRNISQVETAVGQMVSQAQAGDISYPRARDIALKQLDEAGKTGLVPASYIADKKEAIKAELSPINPAYNMAREFVAKKGATSMEALQTSSENPVAWAFAQPDEITLSGVDAVKANVIADLVNSGIVEGASENDVRNIDAAILKAIEDQINVNLNQQSISSQIIKRQSDGVDLGGNSEAGGVFDKALKTRMGGSLKGA